MPSPLLRTAPLVPHDISLIQESLCPNDTTNTLLIGAVPSTITKTRRRKSPLLRLTLGPVPVCSSSRWIRPVDIPPTPRAPVTPRFPELPDIPPTPGTPLSPIFSALSEFEEPRGAWPQIELQRAAMEEAVSTTRHLRIEPRHIRTDEKNARSRGSFGDVWCSWLIDETTGELEKIADKRIHLRPGDGLSDRRLLRARQVASGLAYLHRMDPQIVHGDVKPENILIGADGVARLVDFGLSVIMDDALSRDLRTSTGCQNTLRYADPVLFDDVPRTIYTDLWALGWIIYELVTSRQPYEHRRTRNGIFQSVVKYDLPTPNTHSIPYPDLLWPVLEACWSKDLSRRWSAEKVASHITGALTLNK
ncbi:hypothetical protein FRC04_006668 [Tulasnella sp. 424]|nr:hypothetical protein FRC04_006668 [Tulasnella sp. 424]KAG8975305.1 hypothetical protein FRC05_005863 [Tulasnella sp. 425]